MKIKDDTRSDAGFRKLSQKESFDTSGGLYRGPTPPHLWIQFLLEKLKNRED
jgi:hypothetical protein